ncbi:hypothetical protein OAF35_04595 [Verrucomicrobiales bacterium]|nr:hypothetical protein [Verrucomicrobiales bacterium]
MSTSNNCKALMINRVKHIFTLGDGPIKGGFLSSLLLFSWISGASSQSDSNAGLWVGEVLLNKVAEVSVPLDENNVPRAPDPNVPTSTADLASLRLILHVDAAGTVRLLKDVALLKRVSNDAGLDEDVALITDASLYTEFIGQPGQRIASAVFDFGDMKATDAVTELMNAAVDAAATSANGNTKTVTEINWKTPAKTAASGAATPIRDDADVEKRFDEYVSDTLTGEKLDAKISLGTFDAPSGKGTSTSPYYDDRATEMVDALNGVLGESLDDDSEKQKLHNTAASYVDLNKEYDRFLAGSYFSQMIQAAAKKAAEKKIDGTATTKDEILATLETDDLVNDARAEAIKIRVDRYGYSDTRGVDAIDEVLGAIAQEASTSSAASEANLESLLIEEGVRSLRNDVLRYPVPVSVPSAEYNAFIRSEVFQGAVEEVAKAVSQAVYDEKKTNSFPSEPSYKSAAKIAAAKALEPVFSAAARVNRAELVMPGTISTTVTGNINLPAMHPTNPFRHRRNPDHVQGFDISRTIKLIYDAAESGNDLIKGIYEEEIKGLHKPLGPDKSLGIKVSGVFELNRVSKVDTLNGN